MRRQPWHVVYMLRSLTHIVHCQLPLTHMTHLVSLGPTLTSFSSSETTWGLTAFQPVTRPQLPSRIDLQHTINNIQPSDVFLVRLWVTSMVLDDVQGDVWRVYYSSGKTQIRKLK